MQRNILNAARIHIPDKLAGMTICTTSYGVARSLKSWAGCTIIMRAVKFQGLTWESTLDTPESGCRTSDIWHRDNSSSNTMKIEDLLRAIIDFKA